MVNSKNILRVNVKGVGKGLRLAKILRPIAYDMMKDYSKDALKEIRKAAPDNTGFLKKSFKMKPLQKQWKGHSIKRTITNDAPYFEAADKGVMPDFIPFLFMDQHNDKPGSRGKRVNKPFSWFYGGYANFTKKDFVKRGLNQAHANFKRTYGKL